VLIDQEGGRVQRLRAPHWREFLPALDQMTRARDPIRAQWLRYRLIAEELRVVGIDVNCAPLADLLEQGTHPVLLNRLYGSDVELVTAAARACAAGLAAGGVLGVLKHLPGYGRAVVDSHLSLPRNAAPVSELKVRDFAPFRRLNDMAMGMTAHIVFEAIDSDRPATTSPAVMRAIRDEIGFGGLIMTDDLNMAALSGSLATRAHDALAAGCDLILHCNGQEADMAEVAGAVPELAGAAAARAHAALAGRQAPEPVHLAELAAELAGLIGQAA
jgi:beta-N-acetylhexosaminidase